MAKSFARAIVVGASSGIGRAIAEELGQHGARVALVARRREALEEVAEGIRGGQGDALVVVHDVTDTDEAPERFDAIVDKLGGLDLLVYASGVMPSVDESEYSFAKDHAMVTVNLLGAMAWVHPAAALMEAQRSGTIIGISSIAGERGRRGNPGYCATKAGFTAWLEGLRNRLTRYGVDVITIKPGFVDTAQFRSAGITKTPPGLSPISAQACAARIMKIAHGGPASVFIPRQWAIVALIIRLIPSWLFRKTNV